jgi:hypothetical protein
MDETKSKESVVHAHRLFVWGVIASALYILGLAIYAWIVRDAMSAMKPDQFATFLSGVFAPLAFLWLVLGFRQQGDELQNSARALWVQGEELRNSVEQQRALVEVSREQLQAEYAEYAERVRADEEADRAAQPQFLGSTGGSFMGDKRQLSFIVTSAGPTSSDVQLVVDGSIRASTPVLREGERVQFSCVYQTPAEVESLEIEVVYTDLRGNRRAQKFALPVDETGGPGHSRTFGTPIRLPGVDKLGTAEGAST